VRHEKVMAETSPLLVTQQISKRFGALAAVNRVDFTVRRGELRAIIGPNGAGKTTFFNLLSGALKPTSGRIYFQGEEITGLPLYDICRRGIVRTFQITSIFPELTVLENVRIAQQARGGGNFRLLGGRRLLRDTERKAEEILEFVGLADRRHTVATHLSHGDQRLLELSMALVQDPQLLLLDEPTEGLSSEETQRAVEIIQEISAQKGFTILLVEHDMEVVFSAADTITVLHFGEIIAEGSPEEIKANEQVQLAYLGDFA
jgi:branched-chain amino acid transport system ATP-binding protein